MPARAQTGPVIAIPGKAGVPVTINGVIVDGAVIYGDWGLARPGHGELVIEGPVGLAAPWETRNSFDPKSSCMLPVRRPTGNRVGAGFDCDAALGAASLGNRCLVLRPPDMVPDYPNQS